jgi:hypothetical protein
VLCDQWDCPYRAELVDIETVEYPKAAEWLHVEVFLTINILPIGKKGGVSS